MNKFLGKFDVRDRVPPHTLSLVSSLYVTIQLIGDCRIVSRPANTFSIWLPGVARRCRLNNLPFANKQNDHQERNCERRACQYGTPIA